MLEVKHISTGYGKRQVLFDISFEIKHGEIVLLIGSNGSGKSTLLKTIYGLLPLWNNVITSETKQSQSKGEIWFDNENITGLHASSLLKKGLLYIPQKDNLFENLTIKENLEMAGLIITDKQLLKQRIENALTAFNVLRPHLKKIPMKLSGGERKLLTLAMATLHEPKLIMIDEPFIGLSFRNITFIAENLKVLNEQTRIALLIVEHNIKEAVKFADNIVSLKLGKIFEKIRINEYFDMNQLHSTFI